MTDKPLIYIIEEDAYLAGIYARKLEIEQCQVKVADNLIEARRILKKQKPSAIIVDAAIENESGFELIEEIRKMRGYKKMPLIIVTDLGDRQSVKLGIEKGATDYLIKGHFVPSEAAKKIKRLALAYGKLIRKKK
jgi:two-component system, OmpR family, alkaline phosphatase synthesis response regulator PhoP